MTSNYHNSAGKIFFQLAAIVAIVALILSISRLFITDTDRAMGAYYYLYDLAVTSQMTAFLSIVVSSVFCIVIGYFLVKEYDIIGTPLIAGGLISLIFSTLTAYLMQFYGREVTGTAAQTGETVLTVTIGIEWLLLLLYSWKSYPPKSENSSSVPPQAPPQNPIDQFYSTPPQA